MVPIGFDLNTAFRLAGFPFGRPMGDKPNLYVDSAWSSWEYLVSIFSMPVLDKLYDNIQSDGDKLYLMAAEILAFSIDAGIAPGGRPLAMTSARFGEVTSTFEDPREATVRLSRVVSQLRDKASQT